MSNLIVVLNILVVLGMVVSAILAVHFEKLLSSVIQSMGRSEYSHISPPCAAVSRNRSTASRRPAGPR